MKKYSSFLNVNLLIFVLFMSVNAKDCDEAKTGSDGSKGASYVNQQPTVQSLPNVAPVTPNQQQAAPAVSYQQAAPRPVTPTYSQSAPVVANPNKPAYRQSQPKPAGYSQAGPNPQQPVSTPAASYGTKPSGFSPVVNSGGSGLYPLPAGGAPIQCRMRIANATSPSLTSSSLGVTITTSPPSSPSSTTPASSAANRPASSPAPAPAPAPASSGIPRANAVPAAASGITAAEVGKHATAADCYIVYKNSVYDMSAWVSSGHPGKAGPIQGFCGKADGGFASAFDAKHAGKDIAVSNAKNLGALAA